MGNNFIKMEIYFKAYGLETRIVEMGHVFTTLIMGNHRFTKDNGHKLRLMEKGPYFLATETSASEIRKKSQEIEFIIKIMGKYIKVNGLMKDRA